MLRGAGCGLGTVAGCGFSEALATEGTLQVSCHFEGAFLATEKSLFTGRKVTK